MIKRIVQVLGRTILDEKTGKKYSMRETSEFTGIPYDTIYNYVVKYKCKTIDDVWHERGTRPYRGGFSNKKKTKHKTRYGKLTLVEIHNIHPFKDRVSLRCLSCRLHRTGGMSDSIWEDLRPRKGGPRSKSKHVKLEYKTGNIKVSNDFDRNKFCRVGAFNNKCRHYDSCCNARAFSNMHHDRYDPGGECFSIE